MDLQINTNAAVSTAYTVPVPTVSSNVSKPENTREPAENTRSATQVSNMTDTVELNREIVQSVQNAIQQKATEQDVPQQNATQPNATQEEEVQQNAPQQNNLFSQESMNNIKRVEFTYDQSAGESVVRFLDAKGNVVSQVPPEMYLKMKGMLGFNKSDDIGGLFSEYV